MKSETGKKVVTVLAVVTGIVCLVFLVLGRDLQVYYHVYRLWSEEEYLKELIERPEGTPENTALLRFVKTETGRTRLAETYIAEVSSEWLALPPLRDSRPSRDDEGLAVMA